MMYRWSELVAQHTRELAVLETLDMGKPISDVLEVDLPSVADFIRFCGECIDKIDGRVTNTQHDALHMVRREPPRRRRRDLTLELPTADGDLEGSAGTRGG